MAMSLEILGLILVASVFVAILLGFHIAFTLIILGVIFGYIGIGEVVFDLMVYQFFQTMRPVFADIVQELQRSIGFYSSTHRDAHVEKVVGVGNAFLLPGLQKYLQQNLSMPVELPKSLRSASVSEGTPAVTPIDQILTFWVSYGLALQGLDLTKITTNLLPREIAKQVGVSKLENYA